MTDEITLTFPREPDFRPVAHLVLSGLAVRLDLNLENLEDLQLALDALLDQTDPGTEMGDLTVRMSVRDHELQTLVGPLANRQPATTSSGCAASSPRRSTTCGWTGPRCS
jgi:hypothetical protein